MIVTGVWDQLVEDWADVLGWSDKQKGVPVVRQYAVVIPGNQKERLNLSLKMHPNPQSLAKDAQINAIELFKINDPTGNLAGPNPDPPLPQSPKRVPLESSNKKSHGTTMRTLAAIAGSVSGVLLLSFIAILIKRRKNVTVNESSN